MPADAIVGCQVGDEGKGKKVDRSLQRKGYEGQSYYSVCARYQGGANAGHTVWIDGTKYVLHLLPSGILTPEIYNVIGNGLVIDPAALFKEFEELQSQGVRITHENLGISYGAHITLDYHLEEDGSGLSNSIGTTRRGIGPTYTDKTRRSGIRVIDICNLHMPEIRDRVLDIIESKYRIDNERLLQTAQANYALEPEELQRLKEMLDSLSGKFKFDPRQILDRLELVGEKIKPFVIDSASLLNDYLEEGNNVLLEGAQGTVIDVDHGTYPDVTSSNPTIGGAVTGAGIAPKHIRRVTGVVKGYTTRVGEGASPTLIEGPVGKAMADRGREWGASTGRRRRCGWYDAVQVRHAIRINGVSDLALMKLDILDEEPVLRIATGYKLDGSPARYVSSDAMLRKVNPVFEDMDGWLTSTRDCKSFDELPPQAQKYARRIEELAGVALSFISTGEDRNQGFEVGDFDI